MDEAQQITGFWQWWNQQAPSLASLLDSGAEEAAVHTYGPRIAEQIELIHPGLGYRIDDNAGRSRRTLTISANGEELLMPLARRVRDGAPAPDPHWTYSNFVQRSPDPMAMTFDVAGLSMEMVDTEVLLRDMARRVDVGIWHPLFEHFTAEQQASLAAAMADLALGEEHTLCWVGDLDVLEGRPVEEATDLAGLRRFVDDVRARFVALPDMSPWSTVEGTRYDGADLHARVRVPLSIAREPLLEKVVTIRLPLEETGAPSADDFERQIEEGIGADGELVVVETIDQLRTWYCYVNPSTGAAQRLMALASAAGLSAEAANDPTWEVVSHLS